MRAYVYARISNDPADQRAGVERQLDRGAKIAAANGWDFAGSFTDNDLSGFRTSVKRPGFEALQSCITAGQVDVVIVQHQDRLARNVDTFRAFAQLAAAADVRLETWAGAIDTRSATGQLASTIQGAVDEHYSALISEKIRAAWDHLAPKGIPNGGRRPFGYDRQLGPDGIRTYAPREDEAAVLLTMYEAVAGGASLRSVAADLNARGIPTTAGNPWVPTRVRDVVANPLYIGHRVHRGEIVGAGNWPPLIDRTLFERVRRILANPERHTGGGRGPRKYYLSMIARCGKCGGPLVAQPRRGIRRYTCRPKSLGGCHEVSIGADGFEATVAGAIIDALADPRIGAEVARLQASAGDAVAAGAALDDVERRQEELAVLFAEGDIDARQLSAATASLNEQAAELRRRAASSQGSGVVSEALTHSDLAAVWKRETVEWRHRLASALVEAVVVAPATPGRYHRYEPERVSVRWRT